MRSCPGTGFAEKRLWARHWLLKECVSERGKERLAALATFALILLSLCSPLLYFFILFFPITIKPSPHTLFYLPHPPPSLAIATLFSLSIESRQAALVGVERGGGRIEEEKRTHLPHTFPLMPLLFVLKYTSILSNRYSEYQYKNGSYFWSINFSQKVGRNLLS